MRPVITRPQQDHLALVRAFLQDFAKNPPLGAEGGLYAPHAGDRFAAIHLDIRDGWYVRGDWSASFAAGRFGQAVRRDRPAFWPKAPVTVNG